MTTPQKRQLQERVTNDAGLRQRLAAAHRTVLDGAGIGNDELSDDELVAITGGLSFDRYRKNPSSQH